jgi:hypothetical protein
MATKKRRKKGKAKRVSFKPGALKKKKKQQASWFGPGLMSIAKVLAVICVLGAIAIGLMFLEKYVKDTARPSEDAGDIELVSVPAWVTDRLEEKVRAAARGNSEDLKLDEDAALSAQRNIENLVAWLDDARVRTTHDGLRIEGRWRKPVALIKSGQQEPHYVDAERVVLDFVPMPNLPIVEITGLSMMSGMPPPGKVWQCDDLAAATTILDRLDQMDKSSTPDKPLLYEIDRIDVSNFNGRKNRRDPHIVFYTKDNVEIIWGAEWGKWQHYLESTDEEKTAKLYGYYKEYGTLSAGVKYINLRDPQDRISLPIDKY